MKATSQKIKEIDEKVGGIDAQIEKLLYDIPNMPHETVPVAKGAEGNKVVKTWGEARKFSSKPADHIKIGEERGWFSMEWGSKITGTAFPVYTRFGARLERALINMMIDLHTTKHGYSEMWPPALVNRQSMTGTGQLPKFEEDMYRLKDDDYFLIPTAEVPVTNLLRDQTLDEKDLPVK